MESFNNSGEGIYGNLGASTSDNVSEVKAYLEGKKNEIIFLKGDNDFESWVKSSGAIKDVIAKSMELSAAIREVQKGGGVGPAKKTIDGWVHFVLNLFNQYVAETGATDPRSDSSGIKPIYIVAGAGLLAAAGAFLLL